MCRASWEQLALPGLLRTPGVDVVLFHPSRQLYQRHATARSVARAMQVETVSESTKRDLVELMGVLEERIHVIYPGRAADFQPVGDPETPARFRAKHGLPARYLLDLGTLEPRKKPADTG